MQAIQYRRSVPRYLAARYLGPRLASVYTSAAGCLQLAEIAPPRLPGPAWVRVRPRLAGICGSDLATLTAQGSPYFEPFTSFPFVFGHEVVGTVEACGAGVQDLAAGDRVVLEPPLHCAVRGIAAPCSACRGGRTSHCHNVTRGDISAGIQTGFCRDTGGGWSGGFVAQRAQLHRVPEALADEAAVLVEPFACCLHAVQSAPVADDATVLVLGAGTIGLLTIVALRALGSRAHVVAVAKHAHQKRLARALGADVAADPRRLSAELPALLGADLYRPRLGGAVLVGGADVAFECVGTARGIDDALRFTRHHGTVILVGMPGIPRGIDWTSIWHKELRLHGAYTSTTPTFRRALELVAAAPEALQQLPMARFPLGRYKEAVHTALNAGRLGISKTVFHP